MHVSIVRQPHRLAGCNAECFVEFRDVGKRAIHAPFRWRVNIAEQASAHEFFAALVEPAERVRSEEHTSELQSLTNLVCRLLLEKKKKKKTIKIKTKKNTKQRITQ